MDTSFTLTFLLCGGIFVLAFGAIWAFWIVELLRERAPLALKSRARLYHLARSHAEASVLRRLVRSWRVRSAQSKAVSIGVVSAFELCPSFHSGRENSQS
jgi:hypothetical protein